MRMLLLATIIAPLAVSARADELTENRMFDPKMQQWNLEFNQHELDDRLNQTQFDVEMRQRARHERLEQQRLEQERGRLGQRLRAIDKFKTNPDGMKERQDAIMRRIQARSDEWRKHRHGPLELFQTGPASPEGHRGELARTPAKAVRK